MSPGDLVVVLAIGESSRQKKLQHLWIRPAEYESSPAGGRPSPPRRGGEARIDLERAAGNPGKERRQAPDDRFQAGVATACYVNYTLYDNCASVGETKVSRCGHGGKCYDEDVLPLLEDNLDTYVSGYRFVVLHLGGGSHGPVYGERHPAEYQRFKPMCSEADVGNQCSLEQLYNSYDNTISTRPRTGRNVQRLDRSRVPYVFIYMSDHGESLMEEGRLFHGMPPGVPLPAEQAQVPLIVKSSVPISIVERAEYLKPDVFDTVLDLFSIRTTVLDSDGGSSSCRAVKGRQATAH